MESINGEEHPISSNNAAGEIQVNLEPDILLL